MAVLFCLWALHLLFCFMDTTGETNIKPWMSDSDSSDDDSLSLWIHNVAFVNRRKQKKFFRIRRRRGDGINVHTQKYTGIW